jgi:hypothetical protein
MPDVSVETVRVAAPAAFRAADPREVSPSANVTVPVAEAGETVAVRVTACPRVDETGLTERAVVEFWRSATMRHAKVAGIREVGMTPPGKGAPAASGSISIPAKALKSPARSAEVGT